MTKRKKNVLKKNIDSVSCRITDIYIYVMLLVFPLFTGFKGYTNLTFSKYIFFVSVTGAWLISLLIAKLIFHKNFLIKMPSIVGLLLLVYLFFCCVSAAFSPYKGFGLSGKGYFNEFITFFVGMGRYDGLLTIVLCVCVFFGVSHYARPKKTYIYAAAFSVSVCCLIAVLQIFGLNPFRLFPNDYDFYDAGIKFTSTFFSTIGNADLFSAYLCLVLPLVCINYITDKKRQKLLLPVVLITAYFLFACGVSGGILALAVTALVAAPIIITSGERLRRALEIGAVAAFATFLAVLLKFSNTSSGVTLSLAFSRYAVILIGAFLIAVVLRLVFEKHEFKERSLKILFSTLSGIAVSICILWVYFWGGTSGTLYELSQVMHGNIQDSFGSSRVLIWRKTLALFPERPLLGGGPGTLALRLDINFSRFVEETGETLAANVDNAHNDYLGILVNTGLISLLAYLAALGLSFIKAVKSAKPELLCLAIALFCYWVQAFFGLGLFIVSPLMWLMWGLLASALKAQKTEKL